jgi:autotransporter-associated beta strand protein
MTNILKTALLLPLLGSTALAANWQWNNAGPADWNDAANWTADGGVDNDRFVNNGGIATITSNTTIAPIRDLKVAVGAGTTGTINHSAGTATTGGSWMFVGINGGTGNYNLTGGTMLNTGHLRIGGGGGTGTLTASSGSISVGSVRVGDNESIEGSSGVGNFNISGTTVVTSNGEMQVGRLGSVGHVNQTGGTVNVNGGWFGVSNDSPASAGSDYMLSAGDLNLNNGVDGEIGADALGTMFVSGTGKVNGSDLVHVGLRNNGIGVLNMTGGEVNAANGVRLGTDAGATGTIQGDGGTIFAPNINKGNGNGQFNANGVTFKARANQAEILGGGLSTATVEVQAGGLKVDSNGFTITTAVGLDGVGGLTKLGAGMLSLDGANTYTGATLVTSGTLNVMGSVTSDTTVSAGATLTGSGTVTGNVTVNGGTLSPGDEGTGVGTLSVTGSISLTSTSTVSITINDEVAGGFDVINNGGPIDLGGATLTGSFTDAAFMTASDIASLATATRYKFITGAVTGTFGNATALSAGDLAILGLASASEVSLSGQRFLLESGSLSLVPLAAVLVPEPGVTVLGLGALALGLVRRRRA